MAASGPRGEVTARRLWLPWRPRLRLILAYPRGLSLVAGGLHRFDMWVSHSFTGRLRPVMVAVFFVPYAAAQFIGLVLVLEITILAFAVSVYLVCSEWLLLVLMFPFVIVARLATALPWPLVALAGPRRWAARVTGWGASREAAVAAAAALAAGAQPPRPPWSPGRSAARIWL